MRTNRTHSIRWYFTAAMLAVLLWILYRTLPQVWQSARTALSETEMSTVFLGILLVSIEAFLWILRFWILFPNSTNVSFSTAGKAFTWGQFTNTFLPARAGDVLKVLIVGNETSPTPRTPATIGVLFSDKCFDILSLVLIVVVSGAWQPLTALISPNRRMAIVWCLLLLLLVVGIAYLISRSKKRTQIFQRFESLFIGVSAAMKEKKKIFPVLLFGCGAWVAEASVLALFLSTHKISLAASDLIFCLVSLNLAIAVPVSAANLGPYEAGLAYSLSRVGVPIGIAVAVAILHHLSQMIGISILAAVFFVTSKQKNPLKSNAEARDN